MLPQISETIYTPSLPSIASDLAAGASLTEATLSVYFLGFALGVAFWGAISDKIGRKKSMLLGLALYLLSCYLCFQAKSIYSLLGFRAAQGLGICVGSVITQTILRDICSATERGKVFSIISGALAFSPAIGPLLGGYVSELFGWRAVFVLLTALGSLLFLLTLLVLKETKPAQTVPPSFFSVKQTAKAMFTSSSFWGHVLLIGTTNGFIFCFYEEAPFIFIEQLGISQGNYGLLGIVIASGILLSSLISIFLSHKRSAEWFIEAGTFLAVVGACLFTIVASLGFLNAAPLGLSVTILSLGILFTGLGLIIPNSLSTALANYQNVAGVAGSIFGGSYYLLIAALTYGMSLAHNGTLLALPIYYLGLATLLLIGYQAISIFKLAHLEK